MSQSQSISIHLLDSCQTAVIESDTVYKNIYENNVKM